MYIVSCFQEMDYVFCHFEVGCDSSANVIYVIMLVQKLVRISVGSELSSQ